MNEITWSVKSLRQLSKMPVREQAAIKSGIERLKSFPEVTLNVRRLTNFTCAFRLRVGRYRVFFDFDGSLKIVDIIEVKKRDENTY